MSGGRGARTNGTHPYKRVPDRRQQLHCFPLRHTTCGKGCFSDQIRAVPSEDGDGVRKRSSEILWSNAGVVGLHQRDRDRRGWKIQELKIFLGGFRSGNGGRISRLAIGFGNTAFHLATATTAGLGDAAIITPQCQWLAANQREQAQDGKGSFHVCFKTVYSRACYFFALASASSIFLMYLAGSLLKSFRQPLQHILISRPS